MAIQAALRQTAHLLDEIERSGVTVQSVSMPDQTIGSDGRLQASVTVEIPLMEHVEPDASVSVVGPGGAALVDEPMTISLQVEVDVSGVKAPRIEPQDSGAAIVADATGAMRPDAADRPDGGRDSDGGVTGRTDEGDDAQSADDRRAPDSDDAEAAVASEVDVASGADTADRAGADDVGADGAGADDVGADGAGADGDSGSAAADDHAGADAADDEPSAGPDGVDDADAGETGGTDETVPAHRDPERLREAYATHDTFKEMTAALGVDVTPQTVRHHMIKHGIHEPAPNAGSLVAGEGQPTAAPGATAGSDAPGSDAPSADDSEEAPTAEGSDEADGTDEVEEPDESDATEGADRADDGDTADLDAAEDEPVPSLDDVDLELLGEQGVTVPEVREAIASSTTLYETCKRLDLDRDTATRILQELNLLDLVTGRLATTAEREVPETEIDARIRAAAVRESGDA